MVQRLESKAEAGMKAGPNWSPSRKPTVKLGPLLRQSLRAVTKASFLEFSDEAQERHLQVGAGCRTRGRQLEVQLWVGGDSLLMIWEVWLCVSED